MENKVVGILDKVEGMIGPATAIMELSRPSAEAYQKGGVSGVVNLHKKLLTTWHPPTLETFENLIEGGMGQYLGMTLIGAGVQYVGGILDQPTIGRLGKDIKAGGEGGLMGTLAQALIYPTRYNPGGGVADSEPMGRARVATDTDRDNPQVLRSQSRVGSTPIYSFT